MTEEQMIHGVWVERRSAGRESGGKGQESGARGQESGGSFALLNADVEREERGAWTVKGLPRKRIDADTPIVPSAVAVAVWEEASSWLGAELPLSWIGQLTERANNIYANNSRFRSLLRHDGNAGRDWLWAFTRHWLAGLLWKYRRELHARLPSSYGVGRALPGAARC